MINPDISQLISLITSSANLLLIVAQARINDAIDEIQLYAYLAFAGIIIGLCASATALVTDCFKIVSR
jgi:hypothetical protein